MADASIPQEWERAICELAGERYELFEELGQGGMATVFAARDRSLERCVAIKILHRHLVRDKEQVLRFRREAETIARLDHPNIVQIYDLLEQSDQFLAIVMEYVDGPSLRELIENQAPLIPELAAQCFVPILDALAHAHEQGIIHRDLKPGNILIGGDGVPRLTDFGIAHIADKKTLTRTGSVMGSPAYMTPEMIEGETIDGRTDLFSAGSALYRVVTGQAAFSGNSPSSLMRNITQNRRERADYIHESVGRRFADILEEFMAKAPDERPDSVAQAARILDQYVHDSLGDDRPDLKQWINKTKGFSSALKQQVVTGLKRRAADAVAHRNRREALPILERLIALEPDDDRAVELLDELSEAPSDARHTMGFAAIIGIAILLLATAGFMSWDRFSSDDKRGPSPSPDGPVGEVLDPEPRPSPETSSPDGPQLKTLLYAFWEPIESITQIRSRQTAEFTISTAESQLRRMQSVESVSEKSVSDEPRSSPDTNREAQREEDLDASDSIRPGNGETSTPSSTLRFRVIPASASIKIDGNSYDSLQASRGIELSHGSYELVATAPGCETSRQTLTVGPETADRHSVVLHWKDGYIRLVADRDVLVWTSTSSTPRAVEGGQEHIITVPFGPADEFGNEQTVELRVADRNNLERSRTKPVRIRPETETPVAITLNDDQ